MAFLYSPHSFSQRPAMRGFVRAVLACAMAAGIASGAGAQQSQPQAQQPLPPQVETLLARAKVPREALSAVVVDASGRAQPLVNFRPTVPMNPASVMKLVTTYAGLELLGPAYSWNTPVYIDGTVSGGVLRGNLVIQGRGDPKLVIERLWLLLRRVQGMGIRSITGDILLDRSAFAVGAPNPADFDGEPYRPYNASPDALLLNYKTVVMTFMPDLASGQATVSFEPPLANVQMQASVPLLAPPASSRPGSAALAECGDYRASLKPDFSDPYKIAFMGGYPPACGEKTWPVAYADPASYAERAVLGLWQEMGGKLGGRVREGSPPAGLRPAFDNPSPSLAEVIRDINKFSNNVMAQQLFLTLSLQPQAANPNLAARQAPASFEASREVVRGWWRDRFGDEPPVLENGSGLSRNERVTAQGLSRMLQAAYVSGAMPELMSSLPIIGVDGTLRRSRSQVAQGWAHLKTGTLRDSTALAGYVHGAGGRRLVVVGIINHPNAPAARPALEALVDWAVKEAGR
ncbi:MAG: D-alanyl-D-alanine carboxypeptidase/D-alanyl-D-alanine-endopeptidase [Comamonadaceae bacterium]|nr:MAG: D-alanyl-D-alanine carboxypeptidase/D-alanyl-D-alanine-endopeptidase [Comamonadaceae bacterium]